MSQRHPIEVVQRLMRGNGDRPAADGHHPWSGKLECRAEIGQLEGKAYKHTGISFWPDYHVTDDRAKMEWVVRAKAGDVITLTAKHERAGTVRTELKLG